MTSMNSVRHSTPLWITFALCCVLVGCGDRDSDSSWSPPSGDSTDAGGAPDAGSDADDADGGSTEDTDADDGGDGCSPVGELGCEGGEFQICHQGERVDSFSCAAGTCADDASCGGDRCSSAVDVVAGSADLPAVVDGHRQGYGYSGDLDDLDGCQDDQLSVADEASEIFLAVDGISAGQQLVVQSASQGSYAFYVIESCSDSSCQHVQSVDGDVGDELANRLRWTPPEGQQQVIVAARPGDQLERPFEFEIYVESVDN